MEHGASGKVLSKRVMYSERSDEMVKRAFWIIHDGVTWVVLIEVAVEKRSEAWLPPEQYTKFMS
jgi:hypothetical protein